MWKSSQRSLGASLLAVSVALIGCSSGRTDRGEGISVAPTAMAGGAAGAGGTGGTVSAGGGSSAVGSETVGSDVGFVGAAPGASGSKGAGAPVSPAASDGGAGSAGSDGGTPGEERVVLFDGTHLDAWMSRNTGGPAGWQRVADGSMVVVGGTGDIVSRLEFEDVFVHAEYKTPMLPANVTGQDRGNSGIYLKGMYEVQVLDSFGREPELDGCGSIYEVRAPLTVACYPQEVWNTYEIDFQAPRYDAQGNKLSNARMLSVTLNGVVVQNDTEVPGATRAGNAEAPGPAGIMLQDHGNPVSFRNIWVIPR
jgi:hypothetical protein